MPPACSARLVYHPRYRQYDFGPQHPLRPERHETSLDLFDALSIQPSGEEWLTPVAATEPELELVHQARYVEAVRRLSHDPDEPGLARDAERWGLGRGDTPAFPEMHAVSALIAGGTLAAVRGVLAGTFQHAFNPGGGLHHAMPGSASGFCVYNDPAIAIAAALREHATRVLYLDFDAHHGDGVQTAFYDDPRVLTFSIHESGRYLFPGTGFVEELGEGPGRGYSLNLPMEPYTDDSSWLEAVEMLVPLIADRFAPDLIVSQHGCDSHAWDPLTHLRLSTRAYAVQARLVHELAHRLCGGRWVATGGGGYDWVRVVPRSWGLIWAEMSGRAIPAELPEAWRERWHSTGTQHGFEPLPTQVEDPTDAWPPAPRAEEIARQNRAQAQRLRDLAGLA